jgi:hypothetical protein
MIKVTVDRVMGKFSSHTEACDEEYIKKIYFLGILLKQTSVNLNHTIYEKENNDAIRGFKK